VCTARLLLVVKSDKCLVLEEYGKLTIGKMRCDVSVFWIIYSDVQNGGTFNYRSPSMYSLQWGHILLQNTKKKSSLSSKNILIYKLEILDPPLYIYIYSWIRPCIYIPGSAPVYIYIYIYVRKLNQTVLELDFRAVKFLFFPRRDLNPHHCYTAVPFA
jgi:hypothetical protein